MGSGLIGAVEQPSFTHTHYEDINGSPLSDLGSGHLLKKEGRQHNIPHMGAAPVCVHVIAAQYEHSRRGGVSDGHQVCGDVLG